MPELPEVEVTRRALLDDLLGNEIKKVIIRQPKLRWPIPQSLTRQLIGKKIEKIERRAKYLLIKTHVGTLIIHLGMSGRLRLLASSTIAEKHDHVDFCFINNLTLRYHDPRRFGCILWTQEQVENHHLLKDLGPEPLTDDFNVEYLLSKTNKSKTCIKQLLMNGKILVGVGNIYACEALFLAQINPTIEANSINTKRLAKLIKIIKQVLNNSIAKGGTTLKDFYSANGRAGYFQQTLNVYGRDNEPCVTCATTIEKLIISGRSTFYCPTCQL